MGKVRSAWPDFFIVGVQRSGTTSLYEYLKQHPQVYVSEFKEPHFFSRDRVRLDKDLVVSSEREYLRLFEAAKPLAAVGEASPSYLWHPDVPARIKSRVPEARAIIILRDPVERAYSQYWMDIADGCDPVPFYERIVKDFESGERVYGSGTLYVELGLYAQQVARYLNTFGSNHVLVCTFDDLRYRSLDLLHSIAEFLGLQLGPMDDIAQLQGVHNPYVAPANRLVHRAMRHRGPRMVWRRIVPLAARRWVRAHLLMRQSIKPLMDPLAAAFLKSIYEPDLADLEQLLGRPLPELRKSWL